MPRAPANHVIIIGSGIGGLSSAIILAKLGYQVTVLERNQTAGGMINSYRRQGVDCAVGVHYLGSLAPGQILHTFFDYLGLLTDIPVRPMGEAGVIDRYLFQDQGQSRTFDLPPGIDCYLANLSRAFPQDGAVIAWLAQALEVAASQLHGLDLLRHEQNILNFLDQAEPIGDKLAELGCSPGLRTVLGVPSSWVGVPLHDCPIYYHTMALVSYLSSSWRLACSGQDMVQTLIRRLEEAGGQVCTKSEVARLLVTNRQVEGVELATGEALAAETVIAAIHPKVVLDMLPAKAVKPAYSQRIRGLEDTHSIFASHFLLSAAQHPALDHNLFELESDEAGNIVDLRYYQLHKTRRADHNLLSILTSGHDHRWQGWQQTSSGKRGAAYKAEKESLAMELLDQATAHFGNLDDASHLDSFSPLSVRDWVSSPGGSAYGVLRSSSQQLATAMLSRTAVQGLHLAGQSVLAPGVIGTIMGSFATVKQLIGGERFAQEVKLFQ